MIRVHEKLQNLVLIELILGVLKNNLALILTSIQISSVSVIISQILIVLIVSLLRHIIWLDLLLIIIDVLVSSKCIILHILHFIWLLMNILIYAVCNSLLLEKLLLLLRQVWLLLNRFLDLIL